MEIKVTQKDRYTIMKLDGSLDMYTSLDLKSESDKMQLSEGDTVIFDLNEVTYVDSSGIGTLIKIVNFVHESGAEFYITGLKPMIEKIFKVAGLMSYFSILSDEDYKEKYPVD